MRTENEIKTLPLEDLQKMWVELKIVQPGDKLYANAKALIALIEDLKKWREPKLIEVRNIAEHDVFVDSIKITKGSTARVYYWQYLAIARFLEPDADLKAELEEAGKKGRAADAADALKAAAKSETVDIGKIVEQAVAAALKAMKIAAALLLLVVFLAFSAQGQVQTNLVGGPGSYWVQSIAGLNGGANNIIPNVGTNYINLQTNTLSITTNANWVVTNGQATNTPTYTTNTLINVPGLVSLSGYDQFTLFYGGAMMFGTTNVNSQASFDYSPDNVNWQSNKYVLPITMIGTGYVGTNLDVTGANAGYIRLNGVTMAANVPETNVTAEIARKASAHGP